MKSVLLATCLLVSSHCCASSDALATTLNWLKTWTPQNIEFTVAKSSIKFRGCKQKEYLAAFHQPLTENIVVEMAVGYAKGRHSWGVFSQKISVVEFAFVPRYQFNHSVSIGFGLVAQSQTEFKTTQGTEFNLPKNTEWLLNTRINGFANNHYWEWSASSQKWSASDDSGRLFENGATNNKIGLSYNGYF
ncbi:hypothetical protein [uncultured Paraglaciecola sp.]|uniref:hypothetical protein n=1 Tax=uncultured Paraglaciecola sp. TaxID=1765024 RepID=UPI0030DBFFE6|tara:strand:+ start:13224 stop:13793 length:570 start_codon:yes stop_codon:yes gene_type:complete